VPRYRLYFMDEENHVGRALEFDCADDEEAILAIESHRDGHAMELWNRARRVKSLPAQAEASPSPSRTA
jgi:hypothetical protein